MYNDGYYYGELGAGGYQPTHRGGANVKRFNKITPNFEHKEGLRHGPFLPAPYLPGLRLEELNYDWYVIAAGAPVVLLDDGFCAPAGYKKLIEAGVTGVGPQYKEGDVIEGVRNAQGALVAAGEYAIDSIIAAGKSAGKVIGVAQYDVFRQLNSDPHNPGTYERHNYNRQNGVAVLTTYVLEFPIEPLKRSAEKMEFAASAGANIDLNHDTVLSHQISITVNKDRVEDYTFAAGAGAGGVDQLQLGTALAGGEDVVINYIYEENFYATPFAGMTTFQGAVSMSDLVTFNEDSKYVKFSATAIGDTSAGDESANIAKAIKEQEDVLGHITAVDYKFPKQMLDKVKSAYDDRLYGPIINPETGEAEFSGLDKLPGSANDGVPHMIHYAGGDTKTGIVRFHLHL